MSTSPGTPSRVLVIEDEEPLAAMVAAYLTNAGYDVHIAHTGPAGWAAARAHEPDVVILDLGLPGLDGIEVCRALRTFSDCYVIVTTARAGEVETIVGLSVGADDYVTKPFSVRELVARVQAVLRRPRGGALAGAPGRGRSHVFGELLIDIAGQEVLLAGEPVALTPTERDLLMTLANAPGRAFSRRQLMDEVWGSGWGGDEHLVDVHIARVRRKLGDDPETARYVTTVRGIGYRMGKG